MFRIFFIFIFICCSLTYVNAQQQGFVYADSSLLGIPADSEIDNKGYENITDSILYTHAITISPDTIASWKNNKRFAYVKNLDSLLKLKQAAETALYNNNSKIKPISFLQNLLSSAILQVFFWVIAIAIVLFILYKLFLNNGIFNRKSIALDVNEIPDEQQILQQADYDKLIQQSFKLADYRMAVRYLFLKTLWQLSDKGFLQLSTEKTNYQYVREITGDKKKDFASLVLNYEYIWYGHLNINREQFESIEKYFLSFFNKI